MEKNCYADIDPGDEPRECVIDTGNITDCLLAMEGVRRNDCKYWRSREINQKRLSEILGITRGHLSKLLSKTTHGGISVGRAMRLEKRTGIPAQIWLFRDGKGLREELEMIYGKIIDTRGRPKGVKNK